MSASPPLPSVQVSRYGLPWVRDLASALVSRFFGLVIPSPPFLARLAPPFLARLAPRVGNPSRPKSAGLPAVIVRRSLL